MLDPKLVMMLAVGTLLLLSGIVDRLRHRSSDPSDDGTA